MFVRGGDFTIQLGFDGVRLRETLRPNADISDLNMPYPVSVVDIDQKIIPGNVDQRLE